MPRPPPGDLPGPGTEPESPVLAGGFFTTRNPNESLIYCKLVKEKWTHCGNGLPGWEQHLDSERQTLRGRDGGGCGMHFLA